eukprot:8991160-Alexandrium_andersonii.AAC.1
MAGHRRRLDAKSCFVEARSIGLHGTASSALAGEKIVGLLFLLWNKESNYLRRVRLRAGKCNT